MNVPKPAIIVGLVALIGVYVATQRANEEGPPPAATHTHADGTVHEGASHGGEAAPSSDAQSAPQDAPQGAAQSAPPNVKPNGKLQIQDIRKGTGATAQDGKTLSMHYRGTLLNGKQFDASYDRGQPFEFVLGGGQVIRGWDQGIKNMKVGGKRRLVIPADLAYGAQSPSPDIPANSTLVFEVELLGVQ